MITRIEIIDLAKTTENSAGSRVYVNLDIKDAWVSLQDDERTMKIFINESESK